MFLDSNVSDFKMLPDLLDSLKREREKLRKQVLKLIYLFSVHVMVLVSMVIIVMLSFIVI